MKYWVLKQQVRGGLKDYTNISQITKIGFFGNIEINQEYDMVAFQHL